MQRSTPPGSPYFADRFKAKECAFSSRYCVYCQIASRDASLKAPIARCNYYVKINQKPYAQPRSQGLSRVWQLALN